MSLREEQYRALKKTRKFLSDCCTEKGRVNRGDLRDAAYSCIRHFPHLDAHGKPRFSRDPFGPDEVPKR